MKEPEGGWAQHKGKGGWMRYGREDCRHKWRYRKDGWEEACVPMICIKCGAFACQCAIIDKKNSPSKNVFFGKEAANGCDNVNGQWINPYVNSTSKLPNG